MEVDLPLPLLSSAPQAPAAGGGGVGGRGAWGRRSTNQPPSSGFDARQTWKSRRSGPGGGRRGRGEPPPGEVGGRPEGRGAEGRAGPAEPALRRELRPPPPA